MRNRTTTTVAGVAAALLLFTSAALAQEGRSQVTVQGTGLIIKNSDGQGISNEATKSAGLLVGYSYQFHRWGGVEANYGYARNTQKYSDGLAQTAIQSNIHEITGSFVLHIPVETNIVRPYALAGGGALIFDPTDNISLTAADQQTRGTFVYGGGVNFDITPNFGVRAEYRGFVYKTPDFTIGNLNLDKFTHLAQPSAGIFVRF
jgi:opacity protein-like surface antigen